MLGMMGMYGAELMPASNLGFLLTYLCGGGDNHQGLRQAGHSVEIGVYR